VKSVAVALVIPPLVALPLAVITGLASTGFFVLGFVVGWFYLRSRIQIVRGVWLFLLYIIAEGLTVVIVALALGFFASPW
jgi:hypothetical protein